LAKVKSKETYIYSMKKHRGSVKKYNTLFVCPEICSPEELMEVDLRSVQITAKHKVVRLAPKELMPTRKFLGDIVAGVAYEK
jgi:hypothetical protein